MKPLTKHVIATLLRNVLDEHNNGQLIYIAIQHVYRNYRQSNSEYFNVEEF